jgi:hypothetical protein
MVRFFKILSNATPFLFLLIGTTHCLAQSSSSALPDFAIVLEANSRHREYRKPTEQHPLLHLRTIKVSVGDTRETLLRKNGLFVNANSLMLFDLVNPQLNHKNPSLHSELNVPSILDDRSLMRARRKGIKIKVVLYAQLKSEIKAIIDYGLCNVFLTLPMRDDLPEIRRQLERTRRSAKRLLNENRFTSENTLKLLKATLETRNEMLHGPCGADDEGIFTITDKFRDLAAGLESTIQSTSGAQTSDVHVRVQTVGLDGRPYQNLEVFSCPEWLWPPERFPNLSSPSERDLSVGDYVFSADGKPYNLECKKATDIKIRPQPGVFTVTIRCEPVRH